MKKLHGRSLGSRIATICLLVMLFVSLFCESAWAANTTDTPFGFSIAGVGYTEMDNTQSREKTNSSSVYLNCQYGTNPYVRVKALGATTAKGTPTTGGSTYWTNCTYVAGIGIVEYVYCGIGKDAKYAIQSLIYENGFRHAKLAFNSVNLINREFISGVWSPDCAGTYVHPTNKIPS